MRCGRGIVTLLIAVGAVCGPDTAPRAQRPFSGRLPVATPTLAYSTYLGGSGSDEAYALAVDPLGNSYITGVTSAARFAVAGGRVQSIGRGGATDAFVAKLTPSGALVYLTFLGGSGDDEGLAIHVDASGNVWLAGRTSSADFPVTPGAFQRVRAGGWDAFLAKLDPSGANLLYSTYLGGSNHDKATALAVSASGEAYLAGETYSSDFPVSLAGLQKDLLGGMDAFVAKLDRAGKIAYSTFLGGKLGEAAYNIAVDLQGNAIIVGETDSNDFPTRNALQPQNLGDVAYKTTDGAASWTPVRFGERFYLQAWAIDPLDSANVYAGTTAGVFKSTDEGRSWIKTNSGLTSLDVRALAVDPKNPVTVYAATSGGGLFKSTDRGSRWSPANAGLTNTNVQSLALDATNPSRMFVGTWGGGVFKSLDGGQRWNPINSGLASPHIGTVVLDPRRPSVAYAAPYQQGIFRTTDDGATWNAINTGLGQLSVNALAVDPVDTSVLYAGADGVYKSTNGGGNWTRIVSGLDANSYAYTLVIDPANPLTVYAGCNTGPYKSTDGGSNWTKVSTRTAGGPTTRLVMHPSRPSVLYAATPPTADAFVTKLDAQGAGLVFSTYLGGLYRDWASGVHLDASGYVYVTGTSYSTDFPATPGAFQTAHAGDRDAFVVKLTPSGGALLFSTLIGGPNAEEGVDVTVTPRGEVILAGWTTGRVPVTPDAFQRAHRGGHDAFLTLLSPDGSQVRHSTYLGGRGLDRASAVEVDASGNIYLAGRADSPDFPTSSPLQASHGGSYDAFIAKFSEVLEPFELVLATPASLPPGVAGDPYLEALTALGGRPPYRWSLESGALPPGLSLETDTGVLSGTPTTPGNYSFTVRVTDSAQTYAWRSFTLTVKAPPRLTITCASPLPVGGVGTPYSFTLTAAGGTPPYAWEMVGGSLPPGLSLNPVTGLITGTPTTAGDYPLKIRVTDKAGDTHAKDFSIAITPPVSVAAVVNAATLQPGPVAPGEIVTLFGSGLGPTAAAGYQLVEGQMATSVAETQVFFDNIPAPLVYVQANQLSTIVPYAVAGAKETKIQVEYKGARSGVITVPVAPSAPGIFTVDASGKGPGAILNQDYTVNSVANPAQKGSVVLVYATGEGETDPQVADGLLASPEVLPRPKLPVSVKIGGLDAEVLYAGAAPWMVVGLLQVNVRVPPTVASASAVPVVLTVGATSSQAGVTMAVR